MVIHNISKFCQSCSIIYSHEISFKYTHKKKEDLENNIFSNAWSICKMHWVIVQRDAFNENGCFDMFCFNLEWWAKRKWGDNVATVPNLIRCLREVEEPHQCHPAKRAYQVCKAPDTRSIKINVEGSYFLRSSKEGITRIFRVLSSEK